MKTAEGPRENLESWGAVLSLLRADTAGPGGAPYNQHPETLNAETRVFQSGAQRSLIRSQRRHAC